MVGFNDFDATGNTAAALDDVFRNIFPLTKRIRNHATVTTARTRGNTHR